MPPTPELWGDAMAPTRTWTIILLLVGGACGAALSLGIQPEAASRGYATSLFTVPWLWVQDGILRHLWP